MRYAVNLPVPLHMLNVFPPPHNPRMFIVLALIEISFLGSGAAYVNNTKRNNTSWPPSYQQPRQAGYSDLHDGYASQASQDISNETVLSEATGLTAWSQSQPYRGAATQAVSQDDFRNMAFSQDMEAEMANLLLSQNP